MFSVKFLIGAAAAAMLSTTAFAADMPQPLPQPFYQPVVAEPCCSGGWYLRGDVGIGILSKADLVFEQNPLNASNFKFQNAAIDDTVFFMAGIGYEFNNWLRFDVTGEYRTKAAINAHGLFNNGGAVNGDLYTGSLRSTVFLANGYIDLGTWNCLTPFIGAGVGVAFNTLDDFVDTGIGTSGSGIGGNPTKANLAWALHAGVSYAVTQNFSVEMAYRYLNYGSVTDTINCVGGCNPDSYKFQNLSSNDLMLGFRWRFPVESVQSTAVMVQQPVMVQPAPVMPSPPQYPQPQYPQPQYPLSTRG